MKMPWNRPAEPPAPASKSALADLDARLHAVEERLAHIGADAGLLRIEWSEVLDKVAHWASRQSGRDAKKAKEALANLAQDAPGSTITADLVPQYPPNSKAALRALVRARGRNGG